MLFPNILGPYYSYSNIELTVNGLQIAGIKSINYKDNLGRQFVRGTAMQPLGLTQGRYEASGDFEIYLEGFQLLMSATAAVAIATGGSFRQVPITATIAYGPNLAMAPLPFILDIIPAFFIGEITADNSESEDALTRKVQMLIPTQIQWGGVPSIIEPQVLAAVA